MKTLDRSQFTFREARVEDIPRLKFIRDHVKENVLVTLKIEEADYEKGLFQDGKGWVCETSDEIAGFSCGRPVQGDVWALFVDSKYEGLGIGNHLMELLENWMFSQGCQQIVLSTQPGTRAEKLYRRRGWKFMKMNKHGDAEFILMKR